MRATARRIELAIIGPVTNHTCIMDYDNTALLEEIADLRAELARKNKIIDKMLGVKAKTLRSQPNLRSVLPKQVEKKENRG
jgi:hypothetical protein